jgi:HPt (histidine-containing phosphotransfer) domain-containing protein
MDGYCTKPIDREKLIATIQSLLPAALIESSGKTSSAPARTDSSPVTKAVGPSSESDQKQKLTGPQPLDYDALLRRCAGKPALVGRVLETLARQASEALTQLESAVKEHDLQRIARVAHGLKGAAGMACAQPLRETAARLEHIGAEEDSAQFTQCLLQLQADVRECNEYVRSTVAGLNTSTVGKLPALAGGL